ncbi:MAG: LysR family transcriptional regulator [Gammaproteobacteria bacterium]|nr:LysR family transcriptional regulator [Gammaproteobacteria bacterium]
MDIRQLKTFISLIDNDFNVSHTAEILCLVQSAVSQQIKRLEQELGFELFMRKGKRLTGLTPLGREVEAQARDTLKSVNNICLIADEQRTMNQGVLRIGCTHTQARYVLPPVIHLFNRTYPDIEFQIHQGNPQQLVEWASHDQVDFSICTEELGQSKALDSIACYQWNRSLITPLGHPLQHAAAIILRDLCKYPIITYVAGFTGRQHFNETFAHAGLDPNIVLSAADTDIIKAYVLDGIGIGVIASMAYDEKLDTELAVKDLSHLFPAETTRIAFQKNKYIRRFQQTFIDIFLKTVRQDKTHRFHSVSN